VNPRAVKDLTAKEADLAMIFTRVVVEDDTGDAEKDIAVLEKYTRTSQSVPRLVNDSLQVECARRVSKNLLRIPDHGVVIQLLSNLNKVVGQIEWFLHTNFGRRDS